MPPRPARRGGDRGAVNELLPLIMFSAVLACIFSGYPVAFSLGGVSLLFAWIGVQAGFFDWK